MQKITMNDIAFLIGLLSLVSGVLVQFGAGPALITAGVILMASGIAPHVIRSIKRVP